MYRAQQVYFVRLASEAIDRIQQRLSRLRDELTKAESSRLRWLWGYQTPESLRRQIQGAEQELMAATAHLRVCRDFSKSFAPTRERVRHQQRLEQQRAEAWQRELAARQQQRDQQFQVTLQTLQVERARLVIRKQDYKRGNPLDNFMRTSWMPIVQEMFAGQCFVCQAPDGLTLDHLWLPKNEGGNFVMCVRENALLLSNLLVLCRPCNAAKGERPVEHFFSPEQIGELTRLQRHLSAQIMADADLRKVAGRWYRCLVGGLPTSDA